MDHLVNWGGEEKSIISPRRTGFASAQLHDAHFQALAQQGLNRIVKMDHAKLPHPLKSLEVATGFEPVINGLPYEGKPMRKRYVDLSHLDADLYGIGKITFPRHSSSSMGMVMVFFREDSTRGLFNLISYFLNSLLISLRI